MREIPTILKRLVSSTSNRAQKSIRVNLLDRKLYRQRGIRNATVRFRYWSQAGPRVPRYGHPGGYGENVGRSQHAGVVENCGPMQSPLESRAEAEGCQVVRVDASRLCLGHPDK